MNTMKYFAVAASVGALVITMSACSPSGGADNGASEGSTLTVGSDLTYPPYAYLDGDKPAGFDPELVDALAKEMGDKVEIKDTRFEQLIPNLNADQFDVIASALYITAERAKEIDYIPYFATGNSIVVLETASPIVDVEGLCGLKVAVIKGGDIVNRLRDEASLDCTDAGKSAIDVREFTTDPEGTQALVSGQVDAQVTDAAVATTLGEKSSAPVKITSKELLYPVQVGLGVKKGNTKVFDRLTKAMETLQANGSLDKLYAKYNLAPADPAEVEKILGSN